MVGNPEDRFSHNEAQYVPLLSKPFPRGRPDRVSPSSVRNPPDPKAPPTPPENISSLKPLPPCIGPGKGAGAGKVTGPGAAPPEREKKTMIRNR